MGDFVAFKAAMALHEKSGDGQAVKAIYEASKMELTLPAMQCVNAVKKLYEPFSAKEISAQIARNVTAPHIKAKVEVIYQSIENLHAACPNHKGDWYFTGDYPTPGGNRVVNRAFVNYMEGNDARAYG